MAFPAHWSPPADGRQEAPRVSTDGFDPLTADPGSREAASLLSVFGHAILINSTSGKEKGAWDGVELFTTPIRKGREASLPGYKLALWGSPSPFLIPRENPA